MNLEEMSRQMKQQQADKYAQPAQNGYGLGDACDVKASETCGQSATRRSTEREHAEKRFGHHSAELNKADRAIAFYRDHPEFDEFIQLIREGVVQI